jgi:hypothetical protein
MQEAFQCRAKPNADLPWKPGNCSREGSLYLTVHYRSCATRRKADVESLLTRVILKLSKSGNLTQQSVFEITVAASFEVPS